MVAAPAAWEAPDHTPGRLLHSSVMRSRTREEPTPRGLICCQQATSHVEPTRRHKPSEVTSHGRKRVPGSAYSFDTPLLSQDCTQLVRLRREISQVSLPRKITALFPSHQDPSDRPKNVEPH